MAEKLLQKTSVQEKYLSAPISLPEQQGSMHDGKRPAFNKRAVTVFVA